jgi:hypothetical protein
MPGHLPQIVVGMAVTRTGIPVRVEAGAAGTHIRFGLTVVAPPRAVVPY